MADTDEMNTQATETMEQPEEEICQENLPVATSGSTDMEDEEEPYLASDMPSLANSMAFCIYSIGSKSVSLPSQYKKRLSERTR